MDRMSEFLMRQPYAPSRQIAAAEVASQLSPNGGTPATEGQARSLAGVVGIAQRNPSTKQTPVGRSPPSYAVNPPPSRAAFLPNYWGDPGRWRCFM